MAASKSAFMSSIIILFVSLFGRIAGAPSQDSYRPQQVSPASQAQSQPSQDRKVSYALFDELEELSRIVDIAYCVGTSGIYKPFSCISRCHDFPGFELVDTWNTGPLLSDSCGYIALDHTQHRIIVAFRGTYSIANTIVDLSTIPQEYIPYPGNEKSSIPHRWLNQYRPLTTEKEYIIPACTNCTVHSGFYLSWSNTRSKILPHISSAHLSFPAYTLHLVGHSLGGAVAALAGLELKVLHYSPIITTFGEPRIGNLGLRNWLDAVFELNDDIKGPNSTSRSSSYRRVTHVDDPVPLLPLTEWGFKMHAGEVFIAKGSLVPQKEDLKHCMGDEDDDCIAGYDMENHKTLSLPARYKMWQLLFAHRDYFWRLGLCVPGGDPFVSGSEKHRQKDEQEEL